MDRIFLKIQRHNAALLTHYFGEETRIKSISRSSVKSYQSIQSHQWG
jgi:hypothetical protein